MTDQRCRASGREKDRFPDERSALDELAAITVRAMNGNRPGRRNDPRDRKIDGGYARRLECAVYKCRSCGGWHLTARPWDRERIA